MKKFLCYIAVAAAVLTPLKGYSQYQMKEAYPGLPAFSLPLEMLTADDETNRLFVVQQRGLIYVFDNSPSVATRKTFINLSSKVSPSGSELGLLGLAFHPGHETNRHFYVYYTFDSASVYWSRLSRYTASLSNPDTAVLSTEKIFLTISQPFTNHNGGKIAFGNDGFLYLAIGDGGSGGDPQGNGQNKNTLLGKILRINIDSASGGNQYSIPVTNPYFDSLGVKKEIYAYGIRNPWKFSFDYPTDRLFCADVGQNQWEEIDIIEKGKNYGWNKMEGFQCYGTCDTAGRGFTSPIYNYSHSLGLSITGGYVYRGSLLPYFYGKYIYADYINGTVWALTYDGINPTTNETIQDSNFNISSFGVDQNDELYILRYGSTTGRIYKLVNKNVATLNLKLSIEGFYDETLNKLRMSDTVKVFARQISSPFAIVDSAKSVIDSVTFSGVYIFNNAPSGTYYFQTQHRNAVETWSASGGSTLTKGGQVSYDFTNLASKAYGSNQILKGSKYSFYSGDIVKDGFVIITDVLDSYNDAIDFEAGYIPTDVTGNNLVDLDDLLLVYNNSSFFINVIAP